MPTTVEKKSKAAPLEYTEFLASLQLFAINLRESACDIDRKEYWEHKEKNITYKVTATAESIASEEESFNVRARLEVTMTGGKSKVHITKIAATYDLHFHAKLMPKSLVDKFCNSDLRLIVWPYFREYVTDVSARMYIPPVILPLATD